MEANMAGQNKRRDPDDDEDETNDHRILRDGEFLRVPLMLMDGSPNNDLSPVQWAVALNAQQRDAARRFGLNDAAALHRPGYRHSINDAELDAKEQAYRDVDLAQSNAWRGDDAKASDTPKGNDREIPLKQITGDRRLDAYLSYQEDVENRWRGGR
jgi:hypothetical protein